MASVISRENRQLQRRLRELEEEAKFLRIQNNHMRNLSDKYRNKISRLVELVRLKVCGKNRLAFATAKELEELLGRLRSSEIRSSSSQRSAAGAANKHSLSCEDDNGLIHSTDSLFQLNSDCENSAKVPTNCSGKAIKKKNIFLKKCQKPRAAEAARNVWWDTIAKLTTDNKKLVLLVDSLKMRVDSTTQLNKSLEKKVNSLSLLLSGCSHRANGANGVSLLRKELAELKAENERLRAVEGRNEQLAEEILGYKMLLEERDAAVEAVRRRELATLDDLSDVKDKLIRANENNRAMETALRLSKVREKRMAFSVKKALQKQQEQNCQQ